MLILGEIRESFSKKNTLVFEWRETSYGNKPGRTRCPANEILHRVFFFFFLIFYTCTRAGAPAFPSATRTRDERGIVIAAGLAVRDIMVYLVPGIRVGYPISITFDTPRHNLDLPPRHCYTVLCTFYPPAVFFFCVPSPPPPYFLAFLEPGAWTFFRIAKFNIAEDFACIGPGDRIGPPPQWCPGR